ncbi:NAD(P)/FAD-dependent oxidoreductase [uncultured Jatrophihabitans sp.]|uniref:NAD(P)/FAD-dependent oxidoreductase n=1 Tax=uncultured Jatrophihabitans sp. TaxID=1610747 RepID=UPI0035CB548D
MSRAQVVVVGAGIAGAACASVLVAHGLDVVVRERENEIGGRLAAPSLHGRRVDLGAAYFTVGDNDFADTAAGWERAGLAREWTDTLDAISQDGRQRKSGPMRWAAPGGLATLAAHVFRESGIDVELTAQVRGVSDVAVACDAVVLAMPDPQAVRILGGRADADEFDPVAYDPVIAVAATFPTRSWDLDAAFVNDDPHIALIADDGARRGDGAPVLVAHSTPELARQHAEDPQAAIEPMLTAVRRVLAVDAPPQWTAVRDWRDAKPTGTHGDAAYALLDTADGPVGVCGDSWCPSGSPRVESAWLSGHRLGAELAGRLTG